MSSIHSFLFICHIVVGTTALLTFWLPTITKKGSLDHVKFGRLYAYTMYAVTFTGASMALLVLVDPIAIKGHLLRADVDKHAFVDSVRIFWSYLLYLCLITYVSVRHGFAVLEVKQEIERLRKPSYLIPLFTLVFAAVAILTVGIQAGRALHIIFGILGLVLSIGMLKYCFKSSVKPGAWGAEHLGSMIGSGIGAYTAFLAFGGRQLFSDIGQWQLIFWIAPGVIGSIAIARLSRKYVPKPPLTARQFAKGE